MGDDDEVTRLRAQLAVSQAATAAAISEAARQALSSADFDALMEERTKLRAALNDCAIGFTEIRTANACGMTGDIEDFCQLYRGYALDALGQ